MQRILAEEPGNHDIRAKAGMVEIKRGRFDAASRFSTRWSPCSSKKATKTRPPACSD